MVCVTFDDKVASTQDSIEALNPRATAKKFQSQRRIRSITRSNLSPNGG